MSLYGCVLGAALWAGCQSGPYLPRSGPSDYLENEQKVVLLDKRVQYSVTVTGLEEQTLSDGRLRVVANVKNKESRRIEVQIDCVFKDEHGFSTGDETPFETLILSENAQQSVQFTSMNDKAKRYTIRIREAH